MTWRYIGICSAKVAGKGNDGQERIHDSLLIAHIVRALFTGRQQCGYKTDNNWCEQAISNFRVSACMLKVRQSIREGYSVTNIFQSWDPIVIFTVLNV
jgi:hypothetical protein